MATVSVTRKDLEKFLPNQRTVRAFESALNAPGDIANVQAQIDAINAQISDINIQILSLEDAIAQATNFGTY